MRNITDERATDEMRALWNLEVVPDPEGPSISLQEYVGEEFSVFRFTRHSFEGWGAGYDMLLARMEYDFIEADLVESLLDMMGIPHEIFRSSVWDDVGTLFLFGDRDTDPNELLRAHDRIIEWHDAYWCGFELKDFSGKLIDSTWGFFNEEDAESAGVDMLIRYHERMMGLVSKIQDSLSVEMSFSEAMWVREYWDKVLADEPNERNEGRYLVYKMGNGLAITKPTIGHAYNMDYSLIERFEC